MISGAVRTLAGWREEFRTDFGFFPTRRNKPTSSRPGCDDKVQILEHRFATGQPLHHPHDTFLAQGRSSYCEDVLQSWETVEQCWIDVDKFTTERSANGKYRYRAARVWGNGSVLTVLGCWPKPEELNPRSVVSRKMKAIAVSHDFGGVEMVNLFGLETGNTVSFIDDLDPIGDVNDTIVAVALQQSDCVLCCWGQHGSHYGRSAQVVHAVENLVKEPRCVGMTAKYTTVVEDLQQQLQYSHPESLDVVGFDAQLLPLEISQLEIERAT